jgi:pimeloyl-ACP methyl ester carboxylesterase
LAGLENVFRGETVVVRTLAASLLVLFSLALACFAEQLAAGPGSFEFVDPDGNPDRPVTVWYFRPEQLRATDPIVFVMHGVNRNGQDYRNSWIEYAQSRRFLLLVPEFSKRYYPSTGMYNQGYMFTDSGEPRQRSKWTFTTIERIFDRVIADNDLRQDGYTIYGHSAGGQFVHRFATFMPDARFKLAIAANAGWYTMPQLDVDFPYGLRGTAVDEDGLRQAFGNRLVILLGAEDTDPNHKHLSRTPEAIAQGPHRLARGKSYFAAARSQAEALNTSLRWRLQLVRGAGHSNSKMSKAAAKMTR